MPGWSLAPAKRRGMLGAVVLPRPTSLAPPKQRMVRTIAGTRTRLQSLYRSKALNIYLNIYLRHPAPCLHPASSHRVKLTVARGLAVMVTDALMTSHAAADERPTPFKKSNYLF